MADEPRAGGSVQPHAGIVFDIGFGDGEFGATSGVEDGGHGGDELRGDLAQMLRQVLSLVVGKHAVFLGIEDDGVGREIELYFFAVDFYFLLRKGSFEAIGGAFVVGAEGDGVVAVHFEAQFIVMLVNFGKFLADGRLESLVDSAFFCGADFGTHAECGVVNIERKGGILHERAAAEENIVAENGGGTDADFDAIVRGAEVVAGLGGGDGG